MAVTCIDCLNILYIFRIAPVMTTPDHKSHAKKDLCNVVGADDGISTGFANISFSELQHANCIPCSRWQSIENPDEFICHTCYTKDGLAAAMPRGHENFVFGAGMRWPKP